MHFGLFRRKAFCMLKPNTWTEGVGWYGVAAILLAYALLTLEVWSASSVWFQVLNATGAAGIMVDAAAQKNWQPVVLNAVWLVIALFGLLKAFVLV